MNMEVYIEKVKGVQAQIVQVIFPTHSPYFGSINGLYTLFSVNPDRWSVFREKNGCSLHHLSNTRESAHIDVVGPVAHRHPSVIEALDCIISSCKLSNNAL